MWRRKWLVCAVAGERHYIVPASMGWEWWSDAALLAAFNDAPPDNRGMCAKPLTGILGRGCFPHECSWLIDNPLRRLFLTPETLVTRMLLNDRSHVLEIGPGSGYFSVVLAGALSAGRLELFDRQPEMLAKARRKLEAHGRRNVGYQVGDASTALPYAGEEFDVVLLVTVLGEVSDKHKCLESVQRVLRPRGRLVVHEHLPDPDFVSFANLCSIAAAGGFTLERRYGASWNYTAIFRKQGEQHRAGAPG